MNPIHWIIRNRKENKFQSLYRTKSLNPLIRPLVSYRMEEHLVQQPPKQPQHMFVEYKLQEPQMQQQQHHQHQMEKLTDLKAFEELKTFEEHKLFNEQKAFEEKMNLQRPPACTCEGECSCHLKKNKNNNQNYFVAPVHYNMPGQPTFRVKRSSPLKNLKKSTDFKDAKTVAGFKSRPKRSLMQQTSDPLYQPQPEVMQFRSEIISNHIHRPTNSPCPTCASLHPMPMCPTCYAKPPTQLRSPFVEVVQNGEPFVMDPLGHKYKMDESSGSLKLMIPKQFSESMELKPLMDETQLGNSKLEEQDLHFIHETVQGNQHFQKASRPQKKGELTEGALEQQIDFFRYLHELNKQLKPQY